jgi:hypothetical protein
MPDTLEALLTIDGPSPMNVISFDAQTFQSRDGALQGTSAAILKDMPSPDRFIGW